MTLEELYRWHWETATTLQKASDEIHKTVEHPEPRKGMLLGAAKFHLDAMCLLQRAVNIDKGIKRICSENEDAINTILNSK